MGAEVYLFAIFVFVLLCILLVLYRYMIIGAKQKLTKESEEETAAKKEREERLFRLYQNMEEMMDNFEAYIEETRESVEAAKAEMRQQAQTIGDLIARGEATEMNARSAAAMLRNADKPAEPKRDAASIPAEEGGRRLTRQDAIRELLAKGLTVEQIAQRLELSINEVRLVVYGLMAKKPGAK
jgi:hypothetical protein